MITKVKPGSNMYQGWVTHTHTHLAGECPHRCSYCYVQAIANRFGHDRYKGELRLVEKELEVRYGSGKAIFIEHCNDLFADGVPHKYIEAVLCHCNQWPDNNYVFQTKNPGNYLPWMRGIVSKPNWTLGCTIETSSADIAASVSGAPPPFERAEAMRMIKRKGVKTFITIEPILSGDMTELAAYIDLARPDFVNIGADSKGTGLFEPTAYQVRCLIDELKACGIEIREKRNLDRLLKKGDS